MVKASELIFFYINVIIDYPTKLFIFNKKIFRVIFEFVE